MNFCRSLLTGMFCVICSQINGQIQFLQTGYIDNFQNFGVEEGLPSNSVYSICEDQNGFIWAGTADGLCRFDGYHIKTYRNFSQDSTTLRKNFVRKLLASKNGDLWIGMEHGLVRYNILNGQFFYSFIWSKSLGENIFNQTYLPYYEMEDGRILAINSSFNHVVINPHKNTVELFFPSSSPLYTCYPVAWDENRIVMLKDGVIFTYYPFTGKHEQLFQTEFRKPLFPGAGCLKDSFLYLSYEGVIIKIDLENHLIAAQLRLFEDSNPINAAGSIILSPNKDFLIIGTKGTGLHFFDLELKPIATFKSNPKSEKSLSSNIVECLYIDGQNHLWMGTDLGGFSCLTYTNRFNTLLKNKFISSIYYLQGILYVSVYNEGLYKVDQVNKTCSFLSVPSNPKNIRCISNSEEKLLLGCEQGIIQYDPQTGKQEVIAVLPNNDDGIRQLYKNSEHEILVCTGWGVYKLTDNGSKWNITEIAMGVNANKIIRGFNNELLICNKDPMTDSGSGRMSPYLVKRNGHYVLDRTSQAVKLNNSIWIAGSYGLVKLNQRMQVSSVFDFTNSELQTLVMSMEGNHDQIWLGTNNRLFMLDVPNSTFYSFDSFDGLPNREFVSNASYYHNGKLYFGTISGLVSFDPELLKLNHEIKKPQIIALQVFNEDLSYGTGMFNDSLVLNHDQNTLYVEFSSPNPALQNRVRYAYQLGNGKWVNIDNDNGIWLTNLSPGKYPLNIKATSSDGIWSQRWTVMYIYIRPPYWQTWWFISTLTILLAGMISLIVYRVFISRQKKRIALLEKQEALNHERIRISKDLHDELGSGLSKIKFLSDLALNDKERDVQLNRLKSISEVSGNVVNSIKELVWLMQSENTTLDILLASIREYTYDYLDAFSIEPEIHFPEPIPPIILTKNAYRNIFMIVKESLQNIVKHSRAGQVKLQIEIDSIFHLTIRDNGKGFSHDLKKGHGLGNMQERVDQLGGKFVLTSTNQGTLINVKIPLNLIRNL